MADYMTLAIEIAIFILVAAAGFAIGKAAYRTVLMLANRLVKKTKSNLDDYILNSIEGPLEAIIIFLTLYVLSEFVSQLSSVRELILHYSLAIIVILAAYAVSEVFGAFLRWYYEEGRTKSHLKMDVTLLPFIRKLTRIAIMFIGFTISLSIIGIDVTALLTLTSIVALVVGLASQESLANIFAGLALQLDRPYLYGEYLKFPSGEVSKLYKIGLRSTKLEDLNGNTVIISNSEFAKLRLTNLSKPTSEFRIGMDIQLPLKTNHRKVERLISNEIKSRKVPGISRADHSVFLEKLGMDNYILHIEFWLTDYKEFGKARDHINRKAMAMVKN